MKLQRKPAAMRMGCRPVMTANLRIDDCLQFCGGTGPVEKSRVFPIREPAAGVVVWCGGDHCSCVSILGD